MTETKNEARTEFEIAINMNSRGYGWFIHPDTEEFTEVQPEKTKKTFHKDIVKVRVLDEIIKEKPQAEVTELVSREKVHFVGTVKKNPKNNGCFFVADDRRTYVDFYLPEKECEKAPDNHKVQIEFVSWDDAQKNPTGKIINVIGPKGDHETEIQSILLERGIIADFSDEIENEAKAQKEKWSPIPEDEIAKRRDMRGTTTLTIDPKTAKDFDDALSFKYLENGDYEIGVHIADVSHFVTPGSALDFEAKERSFSTYLVDRTIPMLPEVLSNDICSLNPNEDRLAFSAIFTMTKDAQVVDEWFGKTVIHSNKRFAYEDAQETIDKNDGAYKDELHILNNLSKKMAERKLKNGAIKFTKDEFEFELDPKMVPVAIKKKEHLDTHSLIEEFMLLANKSVAKFIAEQDKKRNGGTPKGLMYRVHDLPDPQRLEDLGIFIKAMGYEIDLNQDGTIEPTEFNALLASVEGKPEEGLISTAAIKTMQKAIYSTKNDGHFGLAFEHYTHFTSPIRRYPDLIVHRILHTFLQDKNLDEKTVKSFVEIADHSSAQEVVAAEAERESIKYKQVEFMSNHVGEEFDGIISSVAKWGVYVTLKNTGAEGLVHITNLDNDYYNYDEKNYRLVGENTGKTFVLGDPIRVEVKEANLDEKKLDLKLVDNSPKEM
jgi:ribonuclease R